MNEYSENKAIANKLNEYFCTMCVCDTCHSEGNTTGDI